jgi:YVTN family beta-propeller protein
MRRVLPESWGAVILWSQRERGALRLLFGLCLVAAPDTVSAEDLAYVANLRAASVSVIDVATRQVTGRISVGADPNGLAVSPDGARLYVTNFAGNSVSVVDTQTRNVVVTIPVDLGPVGVTTTPDGAAIYTANKTANTVSVIDAATLAVTASIALPAGAGPNSVAVTPDGNFAYVTNSRNKSLSILDTRTLQVAKTLSIAAGPIRVVMDATRPAAYVLSYNAATVSVVDTTTQEITAEVPVVTFPTGVAIAPDGSRLYVSGDTVLLPIDLSTLTVLPAVPGFGISSKATSVTTDGMFVYVTTLDEGSTTIVDVAQNRVAGVVCVDSGPFAVAIGAAPQATVAWITEPLSGTKIYAGTQMPVRIVVRTGEVALAGWTLSLVDPQSNAEILAQGSGEVDGEVVAQIDGRMLTAKGSYTLALDVEDGDGMYTRGRVAVAVPDPAFALLPVDPVARDGAPDANPVLDGSGRLLAYEQPAGETALTFLDVEHGMVGGAYLYYDQLPPIWSLSADGSTVVYPRFDSALVFLDWMSGEQSVASYSSFGSIDRAAQRVAFTQTVSTDDPELPRRQVFYYDRLLRETRQVTAFPFASRPQRRLAGPVISGDGTRIAFASGSGWQIYAYDVGSRDLRSLTTLATNAAFERPSISEDGRWLAFVTTQPERPNLNIGALLDLDSGVLEAPVAGLDGFESFDTLITADARGLVVSSVADLDPTVGNSDGNVELFLYDRESGHFSQITDTLGMANGAYAPSISDDGRAAAFTMFQTAAGACPAVGVQRDAATGFNFGRSYTVQRRPGNQTPVLEAVSDARVRAGEFVELDFRATDPDGDRIVFFLQPVGGLDLPAGATFGDRGDGTATFGWRPSFGQVGDYPLRIGALDVGGDYALSDFSIQVCRELAPGGGCEATPTATVTPSDTPSATVTATPSSTPIATVTPTLSPTPAPSPTSTATPSPTIAPSVSPTASATRSATPTVSPSRTPSATGSPPSTATPAGGSGGGCQLAGHQAASPWSLIQLIALAVAALKVVVRAHAQGRYEKS